MCRCPWEPLTHHVRGRLRLEMRDEKRDEKRDAYATPMLAPRNTRALRARAPRKRRPYPDLT